MALKPQQAVLTHVSGRAPSLWEGLGVGSSITMKKNTWTEIIRFVVTVLTALLGTAGMQSCGMI